MNKIRPDRNIGGNLKKLRKDRGWTQEKVCTEMQLKGAEINRSVYSRYELNLLNIRVSDLVALKKIYKCSFDDFFTGLDEGQE